VNERHHREDQRSQQARRDDEEQRPPVQGEPDRRGRREERSHSSQTDPRQREPDRSGHARESPALDEELGHEASSRGPQRQSDGHLPLATNGPHQKEGGHVSAADEQHEESRSHREQPEHAGPVARVVEDGPHPDVRGDPLVRHTDGIHLRAHLRPGRALPTPAHDHHGRLGLAGAQGEEEVGRSHDEAQALGGHPYHHVALPSDFQGPTERGRVSPETGSPGALREQRQPAIAGPHLLIGEEAPGDRWRALEGEEAGRDAEDAHLLRPLGGLQREGPARVGRQALERACLLSPAMEVLEAHRAPGLVLRPDRGVQAGDALGLEDGGLALARDALEEAVHRRRATDPQAQGHDHGAGEARPLAERPHRRAHVLEQTAHGRDDPTPDWTRVHPRTLS
jgi:hypothetical protein